MTEQMQTVLTALRAHREGVTTRYSDGRVFESVYIDNARPKGMSRHAFAGVLGALEKAGYYVPEGDDCFGDVLLETPAN